MTVTEKVAYLKGLAKGLDLAQDKAETKMFDAIMEVLEDMALTVSDLEDEVAELGEQIDAVDEDLADVEELVFGDYDDECDCCDDDDEMYEVECPACHETIYLDESILRMAQSNAPIVALSWNLTLIVIATTVRAVMRKTIDPTAKRFLKSKKHV